MTADYFITSSTIRHSLDMLKHQFNLLCKFISGVCSVLLSCDFLLQLRFVSVFFLWNFRRWTKNVKNVRPATWGIESAFLGSFGAKIKSYFDSVTWICHLILLVASSSRGKPSLENKLFKIVLKKSKIRHILKYTDF